MKINSLVLERKTKSNCMIDLRIVRDRYVGRGQGGSRHPSVRVWSVMPAHQKGSPPLNKGSPL